ncbi:MAG TPA: rhomboid family intramembrane serine protease [Longimicrobiales bacterium]
MALRGYFGFGSGLTTWVKRLLIANFALYLVTYFVPGVRFALAFAPDLLLLRPWTPLTYMFVHDGFWHVVMNMLGLFFFGPPIEARWGSREFIKYYLLCGLGGAAASFLFAPGGSVVGASAAVFGVMLAFAMNWPDAPIYIWGIFPVKAKWLILILVAFTLLSAFDRGRADGVAHFAHLGGFAVGYLYLRFDDAIRARLARWKKALPKSRLTVVSGGASKQQGPRRPPRQHEDRVLDEVDRVLDKISQSGLASLTVEERKLLDEVSKRYRRN